MKCEVLLTAWRTSSFELAKLRHEVFVVEQGVSSTEEQDGLDKDATHFLLCDNNKATLGCARLLSNGRIGRVAVLLDYRGLGLGRKLIQACVSHGREIGLQQLFLHAQRGTEDFYSKEGFCTEGESFFEAGIEHVAMRLNLITKQDE